MNFQIQPQILSTEFNQTMFNTNFSGFTHQTNSKPPSLCRLDSLSTKKQELRIKLQPQPPRFPFVNSDFELIVLLVDCEDQLKYGEQLAFGVSLRFAEDLDEIEEILDKGLLVVSSPCVFERNGTCKLKMRITELSMNFQSRAFCLRFFVNNPGNYRIEPVESSPMTVVRYLLTLSPDAQIPDVWYKDEGGTEKTIFMAVNLLGSTASGCVDVLTASEIQRKVTLKLTLVYENYQPVPNQELLKVDASISNKLEMVNGYIGFKFRIEEVSKNHNKQLFRIQVDPDIALQPSNFDVGGFVTDAIEVRSKRSKKQKSTNTGMHPSSSSLCLPFPSTSLSKRQESDSSVASAGYQTTPIPPSLSPGTAPVMMANDTQLKNHAPDAPLYDAFQDILQWTSSAVGTLNNLLWKPLGYEQHPDGSADHSRPLYSIQNPNTAVEALLRKFHEETAKSLALLEKKLSESHRDMNPVMKQQSQQVPVHSKTNVSPTAEPSRSIPPSQWPVNNGESSGFQTSETNSLIEKHGVFEEAKPSNHSSSLIPALLELRGPIENQPSVPGNISRNISAPFMERLESFGEFMEPGGVMTGLRPPINRRQSTMLLFQQLGLDQGQVQPIGENFDCNAVFGTPGFAFSRQTSNSLPTSIQADITPPNAEPAPEPAPLPAYTEDLQASSTSRGESQVYYICAKIYRLTSHGLQGFPAYSKAKQLIGFYQEVQDVNLGTRVAFQSVDGFSTFSEKERSEAEEMLKLELGSSSGAVVSLNACANDLEKLKENAMMYHWTNSIQSAIGMITQSG